MGPEWGGPTSLAYLMLFKVAFIVLFLRFVPMRF
jgi:hypothetical protein